MKKLFTLSVMFILCLLTFATDFMRVKFKDGNIVKYEVDNIEEVDFEIGKDTTAIGDTTAIDTSNTPLKFRITSGSTAEVIHSNLYANIDAISIPEKVRIGGKIYSVTGISASAFSGCNGLTSIEIPESVTNIGYNAFANCSKLTNIEIPDGVTIIDSTTFWGCSSLASIQIPNSVTSIGDFAFEGCSGLTSIRIPESVTSIGRFAFYRCSGLTSIQIPDGVTNIDYSIFNDCSGLMEINVASNNPIYSSENGVVYNKEKTKIINVPNGIKDEIVIPEGVTSIGGSAFYGCSGLTSINIPEGVTSIGGSAFSGCSGLTSINIPESVTSIGDYAFRNCTNLNVVIDNSKDNVEVENYAFQGCKSVTYLK